MDDPRPAPAPADDTAVLKRRALQRRAKRGLIASYIHGLSERHGRDALTRAPAETPRRAPAAE